MLLFNPGAEELLKKTCSKRETETAITQANWHVGAGPTCGWYDSLDFGISLFERMLDYCNKNKFKAASVAVVKEMVKEIKVVIDCKAKALARMDTKGIIGFSDYEPLQRTFAQMFERGLYVENN